MTSTFSSDDILDRKSLKKPDHFLRTLTRFFSGISSQTGLLLILLGGLLGLGIGGVFYMNHLNHLSNSARNALFQAEKTMESEIKGLATRETPSKKLTPEAHIETVTFKKLDVDQNFPETIKKFHEIDSNYGKTRSGFEARLKIGNLYYDHGNYSKALIWFEKSAKTAPSNFEKAAAYSAIGYAEESLNNPSEALQVFQKGLNLGEGSFKGNFLLGLARNYEAMHNSAEARSTYARILNELPNTECSKSAEIFKAQVQ